MDEMDDAQSMAEIMSRLPADLWAEPRPQPAQSVQPAWLAPASPEETVLELSRCLTLCAPSGMTVEDRTEWLLIASQAVSHIPAGLLAEACRHTQTICDHPAKIVPAICAYADAERKDWEWRNRPATKTPRLAVVREEASPALDSDAEFDKRFPGFRSWKQQQDEADGIIPPAYDGGGE